METAKQLVDVVSEAGAAGTKQTDIHPVSFYCGRRGIGDEWIDWCWSSRMIFNFIRSITSPSQIARTNLGNVIVSIEEVSEITNVPLYQCTPGEIVGKNKDKLIVKTGDSTIRIEEYQFTPPHQIQHPKYPNQE